MSASIGEHMRCPDGTVIGGRYRVLKEVGCGNFAKVYKCVDLKAPEGTAPVAVKILKREYATDAAFELEILKALRTRATGRKVVQMLDNFQLNSYPCFVFKLNGPTLRSRKFGISRGAVTAEDVRRLAVDLIGTLAFLHSEVRMTHTDLKPENILLEDEEPETSSGLGRSFTVADFGSASFYRPERPDSDLISTRPYRAPEVVLGMPWSPKADMWSAGCILFEVYYGGRLFEVHDDAEHLSKFEQRLGRIPHSFSRQSKLYRRFFDDAGNLIRRQTATVSRSMAEVVQSEPEMHDLLRAMLAFEPERRISAVEAMQHPFIQAGLRRVAPAAAVPAVALAAAPPTSASAALHHQVGAVPHPHGHGYLPTAAVPSSSAAGALSARIGGENAYHPHSGRVGGPSSGIPAPVQCYPGVPPVPTASRMPTGIIADKWRLPAAGMPSSRSSSAASTATTGPSTPVMIPGAVGGGFQQQRRLF
jgi:hypothetical protein